MPELPEVETTARGLRPHVVGRRIVDAVVRDRRLRWPVPATLGRSIRGRRIRAVERRAKYLLLRLEAGTIIVHLGMSGNLRRVDASAPVVAHDHVDLVLDDGAVLRLHDPRRFGAVLFTADDPLEHALLAPLGVEPLELGFDGAYLHAASHGRRAGMKDVIMNARVVVGVGNIYASESLFRAGIHPHRAAGRVGRDRCDRLAVAIRDVLESAIRDGGTTFRDYRRADGSLGGHARALLVYDRAGEPCSRCGTPIRMTRRGQRSTYHCPRCQR